MCRITRSELWTASLIDVLLITFLSFEKNIKDALKKSDLIVVHTEWNDFKSINFKSYLKGRKPIIFDMRNIYSPTKMKQQGFKYFGVGR